MATLETLLGAVGIAALTTLVWLRAMRHRGGGEDDLARLKRLATKMITKGGRLREKGHLVQSKEILESALTMLQQVCAPELEGECLIHLGRTRARFGDWVGARASLRRAAGVGRWDDGVLRFRAGIAMGEMLLEQGDSWLALACFREALMQPMGKEGLDSVLKTGTLQHAIRQALQEKLHHGRVQLGDGRLQDARRYFQEALTLARDPLFRPFSAPGALYDLQHFENVIKLELAHLYHCANRRYADSEPRIVSAA